MRYPTPLRYPGGKAKLAPFIKLVLKKNGLLDGHYVEPYAGGAGIALELLITEHVSHIHLNDLNYPLYCFWKSVVDDCDALVAKLARCTVSVEAWKRHRAILQKSDEHSVLDLGFAFFFLNRTNRSGIISGGIIGGVNQIGKWKIDARFNKDALIDRLRYVAEYGHRIHLYNLDACDFVRSVSMKLGDRSLVYLDPPYYGKGQRLYDNYYSHADHQNVRDLVRNLNLPWVVSYDNNEAIRELYEEFPRYVYQLNYSAGKSYAGSEVIFFNPALELPSYKELSQSLYKAV